MYDPIIGRWTTEDPKGFSAADADLYRYCGNHPTNATDPTGLDEEKIKGNEYGDWIINQENKSGFARPYESRVKITFTPNKDTVNATEIAFVQIIRIFSLSDKKPVGGTFMPEKMGSRQTEDGWAIDRQPQKLAWYGYDEDKPMGKLDAGGSQKEPITPIRLGSSPSPYAAAVMEDVPSNEGVGKLQWQFETYAIAKSGKDKGKIYGGISWGFDADENALVTSRKRSFLKGPTPQFKAAVELWDKQAKDPNTDNRTTKDQRPLGPDIVFP